MPLYRVDQTRENACVDEASVFGVSGKNVWARVAGVRMRV